MVRVTNYAANNQLLNYMLKTKERLNTLQIQVSTEKVSQDYRGISRQSQYLVDLESHRDKIASFMDNNTNMLLHLDATTTTLDGISKTMRDFRAGLVDFNNSTTKDETEVRDIQDWAFRAMKSMESYLNLDVAGSVLFGGSRTNQRPVDLNLTTLSNFQNKFDGYGVTYPTTRDAHLLNFDVNDDGAGNSDWLVFQQDNDGNAATSGVSSITSRTAQFSNLKAGATITVSGTGSNDGTYTVKQVVSSTEISVETKMLTNELNVAAAVITKPDDTTITATDFVDLSFDRATNRITIDPTKNNTNALSSLAVGTQFTISGTAQNNGTYTVSAVDSTNGNWVDVVPKKMTDEGTPPAPGPAAYVVGRVVSDGYYGGDQVTRTHRVDDNRSFDLDLTAVHPAFEKAIRAMGVIAQGKFDTAGGLNNNLTRATDAIYLLGNAIDGIESGTPPYGTEQTGNLEEVYTATGFKQVMIGQATDYHTRYTSFLETRIGEIENTDLTEAITRLLDDEQALEASYQTLARLRNLTLSDYLT